jgi:hypothetical protein
MTNELEARTLRQFRLMATKLQNDPTTMAWIISKYQKQEKLSSIDLSRNLKTTEDGLAKLALCKRPDTDSDDFGNQVAQIAGYTKIDVTLLTNLIRQVESVIVFSEKHNATGASIQNSVQLGFSAARDKSEEAPNDEDADETGNENNVADE